MKNFIEEYGFVILTVVITIMLITFCTPVRNIIAGYMLGENGFNNVTNETIDINYARVVTLIQLDKEKNFEVSIVTNSRNDKMYVEYQFEEDGKYSNFYEAGYLDTTSANHKGTFKINVKPGQKVRVRVKDIGKEDNVYFVSGLVEYFD